MKILFYVGYFKNKWNANSIHKTGVGGSEQCVLYLAKQLATKYDVYVVGDVIEDVIDNVEYKSIVNANKDLKNQFIDCVIGVNYLNYFYELGQIKFDKSLFGYTIQSFILGIVVRCCVTVVDVHYKKKD